MAHRRIQPASSHLHLSRRGFLAAGAAVGVGWTALAADNKPGSLTGEAKRAPFAAETQSKELLKSLSGEQKKALCFPFDHPLRTKVSANWNITEPNIETMTPVQQEMVERIVRGLTSPDGFERFQKQMEDDGGGLGSYHIAFFGDVNGPLEFVLTGRHVTMRADGNSVAGAAFGGPMVYGHAASGFTEKPTHPGNVFWYQAARANEVFKALDTPQRELALGLKAPPEDRISLRSSGFDGLPVSAMSSDQKELVQKVMADLLSPYRKEDVDEVMTMLTADGGLEKIHLAFYKQDEKGKNADLGNDGVWDVWRLEGPGFVWHFRGAPHVHTWVNIAKRS